MPGDSANHHRRSIRLRGYDYAAGGSYFVTICTQDRAPLLGTVEGKVLLNGAGRMADHWWNELPRRYPTVSLDAFVIMHTHIHGILIISPPAVGADRDVRIAGVRPHDRDAAHPEGRTLRCAPTRSGRPQPLPTLGVVIRWFKTMSTNAYIRAVLDRAWPPFNRRLWQRNYHDRVIRNPREYDAIQAYIARNPSQWSLDRENPLQ